MKIMIDETAASMKEGRVHLAAGSLLHRVLLFVKKYDAELEIQYEFIAI